MFNTYKETKKGEGIKKADSMISQRSKVTGYKYDFGNVIEKMLEKSTDRLWAINSTFLTVWERSQI